MRRLVTTTYSKLPGTTFVLWVRFRVGHGGSYAAMGTSTVAKSSKQVADTVLWHCMQVHIFSDMIQSFLAAGRTVLP